MRTLLRCFTILSLLLACAHGQAQDTLFLKTGNTIVCRVQEIGLNEVKYRSITATNDIVQVVDKTELLRIKLASGEVITVDNDPLSIGYSSSALQRTHAVKIDFLAPLSNHISFGYEQAIKPWMNAEVKVGIIGAGVSNFDSDYSGALVKLGMKFISKPDYVLRGMKLSHPLAGKYIKPELIYNSFSRTDHYTYYDGSNHQGTTTYRFNNLAFDVVFGKQSLLANGRVCLDLSLGVGYGGQWSDLENPEDYESFNFSHFFFGQDFPLVLSGSFALGYVF